MTGPRDGQHLLREVPPSLWGPWQWAWAGSKGHTRKGLLGTLTPPQEMMMVCLIGLVGT